LIGFTPLATFLTKSEMDPVVKRRRDCLSRLDPCNKRGKAPPGDPQSFSPDNAAAGRGRHCNPLNRNLAYHACTRPPPFAAHGFRRLIVTRAGGPWFAMCAARFLRPPNIARYGAFAAIAASGIHGFAQRTPVSYDSPPVARLPRDVNLVVEARRSVAKDAKLAAKDDGKRGRDKADATSDDPESYRPAFEDDDLSAWANFSRDFNSVREGIARFEWAAVGDKITDVLMPAWARMIPDAIQKLQFEVSMKPGTLADEIWQEAHDANINPEILWDATVRVGNDLCKEEKAFRERRQEHVVKALAKYLDIDEKDIDPEDVPVIAVCGSGGGLRALVAGTSSYLSSQEAGLFDCVTYTAGVSGSCWLQTLYNSSLAGQDYEKLIHHLQSRIGTHIAFPPDALKLITSAPTNKFLLSGYIEKLKGDPKADFGLVDVYGLLLAARLLVPKGDLNVCDRDLKLSNQRALINDGKHPLPIYTAVRHEIPLDEVAEEVHKEEQDGQNLKDKVKEKAKREAWFQWFEFTPYETFCEEFGAGIPTYALGRPFNNGRNKLLDTGVALPEIRIPFMMGVWGSAFCATLSHYYKEIRPIVKGISGFGGLDSMLEEKNDDLIKIHPIEPGTIPNFVYGMQGQLPSSCPESVFKEDHLKLMDAGMSNNLPIYPLLRPGRGIDVVVAFDASADIQQENWLSVVDGYARQRKIKGWPMGAGWPRKSTKPEETADALEEAEATSPQEAATKVAEAREERRKEAAKNKNKKSSDEHDERLDTDLSYCTVWVGRSEERTSDEEPPPSKRLFANNGEEADFHLMEPSAGIAVIYFPLLPNPEVEGVDPDKTDFMSTWNFIYTPDDIEKVVSLARANFEEGKEQTKRTVRAVYERKKKLREQREQKGRIREWRRKLTVLYD
jgi:phospholipase A2